MKRNGVDSLNLDDSTLEEAVRRTVEVAQPGKVVLFGFLARGTRVRPESDLDLLVVKEGAHRRRLAAEIYARLAGVGRAADVVVVMPEDIERFGDSPALIIEPAPREGKVVYAGSPNRYPPDDPREWLNRARFSTRRHRRLSPWPLL